jgi:hypothetical protein
MNGNVFVCEDFPKENQKLANEQLTLVKLKLAIFYILCYQTVLFCFQIQIFQDSI